MSNSRSSRQISSSQVPYYETDLSTIIGAFILYKYLAITRIPFLASEFIVNLEVNIFVVLAMAAVLYLILAMVFDIYAILILTLPN